MKTDFLGTSHNKVFCVDGVDLFKCEWKTSGKCAVVLHPATKHPYTFSVYEIPINGELFTFAAGEFHPDEWAFYEVT